MNDHDVGLFADAIGEFRPESLDRLSDTLLDEFDWLTRDRIAALTAFLRGREPADGYADDLAQRAMGIVRTMWSDIARAKNQARTTRAYGMALGFANPSTESMRICARAHGVTPAAISIEVAEIQKRCRLPQNIFNKSAAAKSGYRLSNKTRAKSGVRVNSILQ